jgi:hypothetical protein
MAGRVMESQRGARGNLSLPGRSALTVPLRTSRRGTISEDAICVALLPQADERLEGSMAKLHLAGHARLA